MARVSELLYEGWSLSPYTLVRTTGFPFELITAFNCVKTAWMLDTHTIDQSVEEAFDAEFAALMAHIQGVLERADVREALFLSSPNVFAGLHVPAPGAPVRSDDRKRLRHLILYLQRLATKCDTNSFFGPTWWGSVGQKRAFIDFAAPEAFAISSRIVLWTHWAVNALAQAISAEPAVQESLRLRAAPGLALAGNQAWLADFVSTPPQAKGSLPLDTTEAKLLDECIQAREGLPIQDLVEAGAERHTALATLLAQGLVQKEIEVPSGLEQPLNWLIDALQTFPAPVKERWLPMLAELEASRLRYEAGDLEILQHEQAHMGEIFESACGQAAARGEGTFYSDRSLLCEEARRNWQQCDLGEPLLADITTTLLPTLYVLLENQARRHRLRQAAAASWFSNAFPGESEVALARLLAVAENDPALLRAFEAVEDTLEPSRLALALWLCQGDPTRHHVELTLDMMHARAEAVDLLPSVVNPDLMIGASSIDAANRGDYFLVLGEVHTMQDLIVRGSPVALHPDKEGAAAAMARQYARILPGVTVAEPVMKHTDKTKVLLPHSLLHIEFGGRAPASPSAHASVLRAGDLSVRQERNALYLTTAALPSIMLTRAPVWSPFNRTSILNLFALPHSNRFEGQLYSYPPGCQHFPRVTVDRLVIHRETWWIGPQPTWKKFTGYSLELWQELRRWRAEHGLPEQVFARLKDEPKPVFIDFRNPLLVDWFVRKLATAEDTAQLSEVLPGAGDRWLRDAQGRYCCEFRMTMYLAGGHLKR